MSEEGLLDRLPDGVVMVGADGKVSMVNAEAERLLGRTRESALGRDFREVLDLRDSAGRAWWGSCSPFASIAIVRGMPEREFLLRGAGSRERWVVVVGRYWRGSTGKVEQVVFGLRDATSRRLQETAKGELISTVSHEIRSPLTSIKGFTSTLLKRWDRFTPEQQRTMLQAVNSDADRVTRLIKELLDISRLEAGRMQLLRRMVDLEELSREVAGRIAGGREGWYAEVSFPEGFPEVYVDR
ncbi:MAG: histidine kinase dimerization/phospho-acceptor domain-containing protein, partial [Actinomycetota bacterium]